MGKKAQKKLEAKLRSQRTSQVGHTDVIELAKRMAKPEREPKDAPKIAPNNVSPGTAHTLAKLMEQPRGRKDTNLLWDVIKKNMDMQVPIWEVAQMVDMEPEEVRRIWFEMLEAESSFSSSDMRLVVTAQLQRIINMMSEAAMMGSAEHAKIILQAIERLNKIYDLEQSTTRVEIKLMTEQQTSVVIDVVHHVIATFLDHPALKALDPAIAEEIAGTALREASVVNRAAAERYVVEHKED